MVRMLVEVVVDVGDDVTVTVVELDDPSVSTVFF